MPPPNVGDGAFGKVGAAKDWPQFKGKVMGVLNPLHVLWTWRAALAFLKAMQAEVAEEAGGNPSQEVLKGKKAGLELEAYKKTFKETVVKANDVITAIRNSRDGILKAEMGSKYSDWKAQNCAKEEELLPKQESYYRDWMIVVIVTITTALRQAFDLTSEKPSNELQDSVRRHLCSEELESILQLDTPYQSEWTTEPWTHPLVKLWLALLARFQSAGEAISGTFMNDLKKLMIAASERKQTFHELDHAFWALMEPISKAFHSPQTKAMVAHMRACYRFTVIQELAEGNDVRAECWQKGFDELHRSMMAREAITLEHTDRAVVLAESHLRSIQATEQDTDRKSQAERTQALGLVARKEQPVDTEEVVTALLARQSRQPQRSQKGERRWCEQCQRKHPMPCWNKSALELHRKSKQAEADGRMRKETSAQQQAREELLDELMKKQWDETQPREQAAAQVALDAYRAVNMGYSGGLGYAASPNRHPLYEDSSEDEDDKGEAAK